VPSDFLEGNPGCTATGEVLFPLQTRESPATDVINGICALGNVVRSSTHQREFTGDMFWVMDQKGKLAHSHCFGSMYFYAKSWLDFERDILRRFDFV
jgi:hypothetical protein